MNGGKKVILHLVFDGILFDLVYPKFEEMENYENRYLIDSLGKEKQFKHIRNSEKIIKAGTLVEWKNIISDPLVDIIYMHGLWQSYLNAVDCIRQDVVVMWWCYGMEIYENVNRWPPLLPLKLYKPQTHWFCFRHLMGMRFLSSELSNYFPRLYRRLIGLYNRLKGTDGDKRLIRLLSRIDYAFTPLSMELTEIKKLHPFIKAKPFVLRNPQVKFPIEIHNQSGGILLEHSANITNNHLDIISAIKKKKINLNNRDIYIPLSYGEQKLAEYVEKKANFDGANVHCLMKSVPYNEYAGMLSHCSHAIFGMLRQSGLGNIYLCFRKGIKVFLFKESILFKQFKNDGYYVYSIENDLNGENITKPLTKEQTVHNYNLFYTQFDGFAGTYEQQFDKILNS